MATLQFSGDGFTRREHLYNSTLREDEKKLLERDILNYQYKTELYDIPELEDVDIDIEQYKPSNFNSSSNIKNYKMTRKDEESDMEFKIRLTRNIILQGNPDIPPDSDDGDYFYRNYISFNDNLVPNTLENRDVLQDIANLVSEQQDSNKDYFKQVYDRLGRINQQKYREIDLQQEKWKKFGSAALYYVKKSTIIILSGGLGIYVGYVFLTPNFLLSLGFNKELVSLISNNAINIGFSVYTILKTTAENYKGPTHKKAFKNAIRQFIRTGAHESISIASNILIGRFSQEYGKKISESLVKTISDRFITLDKGSTKYIFLGYLSNRMTFFAAQDMIGFISSQGKNLIDNIIQPSEEMVRQMKEKKEAEEREASAKREKEIEEIFLENCEKVKYGSLTSNKTKYSAVKRYLTNDFPKEHPYIMAVFLMTAGILVTNELVPLVVDSMYSSVTGIFWGESKDVDGNIKGATGESVFKNTLTDYFVKTLKEEVYKQVMKYIPLKNILLAKLQKKLNLKDEDFITHLDKNILKKIFSTILLKNILYYFTRVVFSITQEDLVHGMLDPKKYQAVKNIYNNMDSETRRIISENLPKNLTSSQYITTYFNILADFSIKKPEHIDFTNPDSVKDYLRTLAIDSTRAFDRITGRTRNDDESTVLSDMDKNGLIGKMNDVERKKKEFDTQLNNNNEKINSINVKISQLEHTITSSSGITPGEQTSLRSFIDSLKQQRMALLDYNNDIITQISIAQNLQDWSMRFLDGYTAVRPGFEGPSFISFTSFKTMYDSYLNPENKAGTVGSDDISSIYSEANKILSKVQQRDISYNNLKTEIQNYNDNNEANIKLSSSFNENGDPKRMFEATETIRKARETQSDLSNQRKQLQDTSDGLKSIRDTITKLPSGLMCGNELCSVKIEKSIRRLDESIEEIDNLSSKIDTDIKGILDNLNNESFTEANKALYDMLNSSPVKATDKAKAALLSIQDIQGLGDVLQPLMPILQDTNLSSALISMLNRQGLNISEFISKLIELKQRGVNYNFNLLKTTLDIELKRILAEREIYIKNNQIINTTNENTLVSNSLHMYVKNGFQNDVDNKSQKSFRDMSDPLYEQSVNHRRKVFGREFGEKSLKEKGEEVNTKLREQNDKIFETLMNGSDVSKEDLEKLNESLEGINSFITDTLDKLIIEQEILQSQLIILNNAMTQKANEEGKRASPEIGEETQESTWSDILFDTKVRTLNFLNRFTHDIELRKLIAMYNPALLQKIEEALSQKQVITLDLMLDIQLLQEQLLIKNKTGDERTDTFIANAVLNPNDKSHQNKSGLGKLNVQLASLGYGALAKGALAVGVAIGTAVVTAAAAAAAPIVGTIVGIGAVIAKGVALAGAAYASIGAADYAAGQTFQYVGDKYDIQAMRSIGNEYNKDAELIGSHITTGTSAVSYGVGAYLGIDSIPDDMRDFLTYMGGTSDSNSIMRGFANGLEDGAQLRRYVDKTLEPVFDLSGGVSWDSYKFTMDDSSTGHLNMANYFIGFMLSYGSNINSGEKIKNILDAYNSSENDSSISLLKTYNQISNGGKVAAQEMAGHDFRLKGITGATYNMEYILDETHGLTDIDRLSYDYSPNVFVSNYDDNRLQRNIAGKTLNIISDTEICSNFVPGDNNTEIAKICARVKQPKPSIASKIINSLHPPPGAHW